jgi:hypothetical protein
MAIRYTDIVDPPKPSMWDRLWSPAPGAQEMVDRAQREGEALATPGKDDSVPYAMLKGFFGGAHEAAGKVAAGFTSPMSIAALLGGPVGEFGTAAEIPALAKAGHAAATAAGAGFGLQGAGHAVQGWADENLPEFLGGVGQAALGVLGARRGVEDYMNVKPPVQAPGTKFEIENQGGGTVFGARKPGAVAPPRQKTITPTAPPRWAAPGEALPEEGGAVPYAGEEPAPYRASAKQGIKDAVKAAKDARAAAAIAEARATLQPQEPTISESISAPTDLGRESMTTRWTAPPEDEGAGGVTSWEPDESPLAPTAAPEALDAETAFQQWRQERGLPDTDSIRRQFPWGKVGGEPPSPARLPGGFNGIEEAANAPIPEDFSDIEAAAGAVPAAEEPQSLEEVLAPPKPRGGRKLKPEQQASLDALRARIESEGQPSPAPESLATEPPVAPEVAPEVAPVAEAPESPLQQLLQFFKSRVDASGQHYRDLKALIQGGEATAEEKVGRGIAGQALRSEAQAAGLPTGKAAQVAPAPSNEPIGVQQLADIFRSRGRADLADQVLGVEPTPGPETPPGPSKGVAQTSKAREAALAARKAKQGLKGETGAVTPELLMLLGRMGVGGAIGGAYGGQHGHPILGALGGALAGGFVPPILSGKALLSPESLEESSSGIDRITDVANKIHNAVLLSPTSVAKKAAGDIGGLTSFAIENPERAAALRKAIFGGGMQEAVDVGKAAYNTPYEDLEPLTGAEALVNKGPLSWAGRTMAGLTAGTKNLMEQAGATPEEQKLYTLTAEPKYGATKGLLQGQRSSKLAQHLSPFARITTNRLERGWERSPLGFISALKTKDPEMAMKMARIAGIGTAVGGAAAAATPTDWVKNNPGKAAVISAMGGPYGIPIGVGMASQSSALSSAPEMAREMTKDIPGLRSIEDFSRSPKRMLENYLSGYSNVLRPLAQLLTPNDPDTSQNIYDRFLSNIPGARETLPQKPMSQRPARIRYTDVP